MNNQQLISKSRSASRSLSNLTADRRNWVLLKIADAIDSNHKELLRANSADLALMDPQNPTYDRLMLTPQRLLDISASFREVVALKSPVGKIIEDRTLPNNLRVRRVKVPFGVVGVVYEARPNVTFDVFALCFKSGNACVLKGGKDANHSNMAAVRLIRDTLTKCGIDPDIVILLPSTPEATMAMLNATGDIDVCIPRGGRGLINFVRENARIPVIETGAGIVHTYVHADADLVKAINIVNNAKTRRVSVCNALDTLLIDRNRLEDLADIVAPLSKKEVAIYADSDSMKYLAGHYPDKLLHCASESTWSTEWMDYKIGIRTVGDILEAIDHVNRYGSGHSEAIVTENPIVADEWRNKIDAACVYVNAPTSFTDGGQLGLGSEIGISTQKLGPRGPMGLDEITTYKWLIDGEGQIRK